MKYLKQAQAALIGLAVACICIRIIWWAIEPLIPYIIGSPHSLAASDGQHELSDPNPTGQVYWTGVSSWTASLAEEAV